MSQPNRYQFSGLGADPLRSQRMGTEPAPASRPPAKRLVVDAGDGSWDDEEDDSAHEPRVATLPAASAPPTTTRAFLSEEVAVPAAAPLRGGGGGGHVVSVKGTSPQPAVAQAPLLGAIPDSAAEDDGGHPAPVSWSNGGGTVTTETIRHHYSASSLETDDDVVDAFHLDADEDADDGLAEPTLLATAAPPRPPTRDGLRPPSSPQAGAPGGSTPTRERVPRSQPAFGSSRGTCAGIRHPEPPT
jgi:hypothetical protein